MSTPDLNLLVTLDVLLAEGSVARAAQRLRLSPSAMSRALARLRETTGDPLLVRAGRGLVPTPRALELRERVGQLVQDGRSGAAPGRDARPQAAGADLHAADQRRLCGELRTGPDRARRQGSSRRAAALRAEAGQGQRAAARRERRSGNRRGRGDDRSGGARAGLVPRPLHRRRAQGASAEPGQDHARPLCGRPAHPGLAARSRHGTDR